MKIAHIAKPIGGVGVYIHLLAKHMNKNFENVLLCNTNDNIVDVKDVRGEHLKKQHINLIREIKFLADLKCLISIIKILKEEKPNIIHCHSAKAGILGRIAGAYLKIPTLYTPHAYSYLSAESHKKRWIYKKIEQFFKFFSARTLACSNSEYNRTISDLNFNQNKVLVWNNSIENSFTFSHFNQPIPENFICSIGRPSYQKNTELLINSLHELKKKKPKIHLVILGVGHYSPDLKNIENQIKKLDLTNNITLIPWLKREEALSILKQSNVYISTSRYEGLPYALIEAIALKKACVVTNVDGHKDLIINNYNGFTTNENPTEIAEKIYELLTNESLKTDMENNSFKLYQEKFNIKNNIKLLEKIYLQSV